MVSKEYDFIIYGATGFTGQFVVEELAQVTKDKSYKLAVAGRNEAKLRKVLEESSKIIDIDLTSIPIVIADSSDEDSLVSMAKKTNVLLNCVGPYRLYGEAVVRVCVENGTSHVDISGEPNFLEEMQAKYHEQAKTNGCYVVGSCGWDSIPCDLGVHFTKTKFEGDLNGIETVAQYKVGQNGYKINTGTYQTIILSVAHRDNLKPIRSQIMPERLPTITPKLGLRGYLFNDDKLNGWCMPFMGSDKSVAIRSIYSNFHERKERPFQIQSYFYIGSLFWSLCLMLWGIFIAIMSQFGFTRKILQNYPEICSFGLFSSKGPTREQAKTTGFVYWFFGRGWSKKLANFEEEHDELPTEQIIVRCDGTDPGYNCTSTCLVAAAMSIHEDSDRMPSNGGVYTPAVAFGQTDIFNRLEERNVTFKVVDSAE